MTIVDCLEKGEAEMIFNEVDSWYDVFTEEQLYITMPSC